MTIGYRPAPPPPLPEQPVPHVPTIHTGLFKRIARSMRVGTGRRGFTPVSAVGAIGRQRAKERRAQRAERRAEQGLRAQQVGVRAQRQQARAKTAEAVGEIVQEVRRARKPKAQSPRPRAQHPVQKLSPDMIPTQPAPSPPKKKSGPTRRAFAHAGLGPQGKEALRKARGQITIPLQFPHEKHEEGDILREQAKLMHTPMTDEDLLKEVGRNVTEEEQEAERQRLQALRRKVEKEMSAPQEHNLFHDLGDLLSMERVSLHEPEPVPPQPISHEPPRASVSHEQLLADMDEAIATFDSIAHNEFLSNETRAQYAERAARARALRQAEG